MPISSKKKDAILNRLREECDRDQIVDNDFVIRVSTIRRRKSKSRKKIRRNKVQKQIKPGIPESFSDMVQQDVADIVKQGLNKNCPNWGQNLETQLHTQKFTYEVIADRLGIHHSSILEAAQKEYVSPFYLEALSLILQITPYKLLGLECPHLSAAMSYWANCNKGFTNVIMNTYCKTDSPDKLNHLKAVTKVGKLLPNAYRKFLKDYKHLKRLQAAFEINPQASPWYTDSSWMIQVTDHVFGLEKAVKANNEEKRDIHYAFLEAYYVCSDLERKNPRRLGELAQIALSDKLRKWLIDVMITKDYPHTHTKLQRYAIMDLVTPSTSPEKEKLRAQEIHAADIL